MYQFSTECFINICFFKVENVYSTARVIFVGQMKKNISPSKYHLDVNVGRRLKQVLFLLLFVVNFSLQSLRRSRVTRTSNI